MTFVHRHRRLGLAAGLLFSALAAISPALAADFDVAIVDKTFDPTRVVVAQGDTVTWTVTRSISEPHTVTSAANGDTAQGASFNSQADDPGLAKLKDDGGTYSFTFEQPGTFAYLCIVHSGMTGEVVVLAPGESAPPESAPAASAPAGSAPAASAPAESPAGSAGPVPSGSGEPSASEAPVEREPRPPVPAERKLIGGGILALTLIIGFAAATVFRRMNPGP